MFGLRKRIAELEEIVLGNKEYVNIPLYHHLLRQDMKEAIEERIRRNSLPIRQLLYLLLDELGNCLTCVNGK